MVSMGESKEKTTVDCVEVLLTLLLGGLLRRTT